MDVQFFLFQTRIKKDWYFLHCPLSIPDFIIICLIFLFYGFTLFSSFLLNYFAVDWPPLSRLSDIFLLSLRLIKRIGGVMKKNQKRNFLKYQLKKAGGRVMEGILSLKRRKLDISLCLSTLMSSASSNSEIIQK